ncbi:hypothetical protein [Enterobacter hormaechei]|uniref:hypothetical protein n=1 Tax=Enterobacter hormaechei TaxID=158836 RepID=UPI001F60F7B8|nr:hypothetical protein [Enterobacter hormaechei]
MDLGSHHSAGVQPAFWHHQPRWALNILFVFAGVTQLIALQYQHGLKGMFAGYLLALMIWPLQPASYGLAGITLAISMATVSGSDTPGVQRLAAITAVLSLICLNGLSHLRICPQKHYYWPRCLLWHSPSSGFILQANLSGGPQAFHAA